MDIENTQNIQKKFSVYFCNTTEYRNIGIISKFYLKIKWINSFLFPWVSDVSRWKSMNQITSICLNFKRNFEMISCRKNESAEIMESLLLHFTRWIFLLASKTKCVAKVLQKSFFENVGKFQRKKLQCLLKSQLT